VGPKLVFDQMAAPVPEIMDTASYACCILHPGFVHFMLKEYAMNMMMG
jgi:hypothetical protein